MTLSILFRILGLAGLVLAGAVLGRFSPPALSWAAAPAASSSVMTQQQYKVNQDQQYKMIKTIEQIERVLAPLQQQVDAMDKRLKAAEASEKAMAQRFASHWHGLAKTTYTANLQTLELLMERKDASSWVVLTKAGALHPVPIATGPPHE